MSGDHKKSRARLSYGTPLKNLRDAKPTARHSIAGNGSVEAAFTKNTKSSNNRQSIAKAEETNISVYVRCRSRSDREIRENSGVVVSTMGHLGKEVLLQTGPMSVSNKTYTFDRVFGAESDQEMVYEGIAKSALLEMLQGYNCTIFAYGQTGTGKTYTMSGDIKASNGRLSEEAGIIPRILMDLFKNLETSPEHSVKVSFIELYNEELRDLLLVNEQEERKVRIFDDPSKKSIVVQGMEEVFIKNAEEGMKLLNDGSYKRQVAATQCNDLSSRSHSVFTMTVHMKEIDPISGEEYLKIGKLNLVDLAGSENINRSGAENKRAREAGMINQSLLTLGRVINALVDQSSHIPYRESKLTRLLQDSLGGKTKTCIIATISPAKVSLDETISTLEYANRAKSIKNKPQVNQTMSKKLLIKEYVLEIERLRNDLNATRNRNGIYLAEDTWGNVTAESESRRIQVEEQKLRIQVLEEQIRKFKQGFDDYLNQLKKVENELKLEEAQNEKLREEIKEKSLLISRTLKALDVEKLLNKDHQEVEIKLHQSYETLLSLTKDVLSTRDQLFKYIDHEKKIHLHNNDYVQKSKTELNAEVEAIHNEVKILYLESTNLTNTLTENFDKMIQTQTESISKKSQTLVSCSKNLEDTIDRSLNKFTAFVNSSGSKIDNIELVKQEIKNEIISELNHLKEGNSNFSHQIDSSLTDLKSYSYEIFKDINLSVQKTIDTVVSQLNAQSNEIVSLKHNLSEHQKKYNDLLRVQAVELNKIKEEEKTETRSYIVGIINSIGELIDQGESKRMERLEGKINAIHPELNKIVSKNENFTKKFESFIDDSWVSNQNKFVELLKKQSKSIESDVTENCQGNIAHKIGDIQKNIQKHNEGDNKVFQDLFVKLDQSMQKLDSYSSDLKALNEENKSFTESQLTGIKKSTNDVISNIGKQFIEISKRIENSKPEVIGTFLDGNNKCLKTFDVQFHDSINALHSNVNKIKLDFNNNEPLPKRQKIEVSTTLSKSKTREEIMNLIEYKDYSTITIESTPVSKRTENKSVDKTPIPVPDKKIKMSRPLSESSINANLPKSKDQKLHSSNENIDTGNDSMKSA